MPTVLRRSGPDFIRDGVTITPRAVIDICDTCGFEGAAFTENAGGKRVSFCGIDAATKRFVCIGKGRAGGDLVGRAA
jgi:hypothetical protein